MKRDTTPSQGHDLVILVEENASAWVFWRWGWPLEYGVVVGDNFGPQFIRREERELIDQKRHGGFNAWVILACRALRAFQLSDEKFFDAEPVWPATEDKLAGVRTLADESIAFLEKHTGYELPSIVRRAIAESLCIGIAISEPP
jgi:hypothetical protein